MTEEVTGGRILVLEGSIGSTRQRADGRRRLARGEAGLSLPTVRLQRSLRDLPQTLVSRTGHAEIVPCVQASCRAGQSTAPCSRGASPRQAGPPSRSAPSLLRGSPLPASVGHGRREPDRQRGAAGPRDSSWGALPPARRGPCRREALAAPQYTWTYVALESLPSTFLAVQR